MFGFNEMFNALICSRDNVLQILVNKYVYPWNNLNG